MPRNRGKSFEVAIIGGGIAGITLAISLLKRNVPCVIYEQAHTFGEVGAGLGISPNALRAMTVCDPSVSMAFDKVVSGNMWESKKGILFEFFDGMDDTTDLTPRFTIRNSTGLRGCHRGHLVNELLKLLPNDVTRFNKQLERIEEPQGDDSGKLRMVFRDGTVAEADAIIGCDGIKSRMREIVVGHSDPSAKCSYTHKFAYRGMVPMDQAVEVLGEERAVNATVWTGKDMHMVTYPVAHGAICNVVAYRSSTSDWPSENQLTLPTQKGDFLEDFKGFRPMLLRFMGMVRNLDRWAMFDLGDYPVPTFAKGRMCIIGDAAHATTPHHGAGAGLCFEDTAVLASLLADDKVRTSTDIEAVFAAFDTSRRKRSQWVVQKSRRGGDLYELRTEVGNDVQKMAQELREILAVIWDFSIEDAIGEAVDDLRKRLVVKAERANI
ncbi:salicylate hydroxylase 1 [Ilyonectria sp. MPI-CAGE-AT-0026]|nr:salicylate hydroxylase 1 [Ilyonectria sp. MPI-CAGE-AT-0026]